CGLVLEPAQDELAVPRATPGGVDQEGDLRVAPFAVEPAIADNGAVVISDPPPLVCNERAGLRLIVSHRGQLVRAEHPLPAASLLGAFSFVQCSAIMSPSGRD